MKKKFILLSLFTFIFCSLYHPIFAQEDDEVIPVTISQSCTNIFLDTNKGSIFDDYAIFYRTACQGSYGFSYHSDWSIIRPTQRETVTLTPIWEVETTSTSELIQCGGFIIADFCENPVIIIAIYEAGQGPTQGLVFAEEVSKPLFLFTVSPICYLCNVGGISQVVDLQTTPITCIPGNPDCDILNKTSSTAYSPKDITLSTKPNPFSTRITIEYTLIEEATISLQVFDLQGRTVAQLLDHEKQTIGKQQQTWNAQHLPPGVYYYQFSINGHSQTQKLVKF